MAGKLGKAGKWTATGVLTAVAVLQASPAKASAGDTVGSLFCCLFVLLPALHIAMMIHVAKDAKARNMDGGAIWMVATLFFGFVVWIVYELAKPSGALVQCPACGNRRLQASARCPHCGNGWRSQGLPGPDVAPPPSAPVRFSWGEFPPLSEGVPRHDDEATSASASGVPQQSRGLSEDDKRDKRFLERIFMGMAGIVVAILGVGWLAQCGKDRDTEGPTVAATPDQPSVTASEPVAPRTPDSPDVACRLMDFDSRFRVGFYTDREAEDENGHDWSCLSSQVPLYDGDLPNNLAYYATGTRGVVKRLKIVLNVNTPSSSDAGLSEYVAASKQLTEKALGTPLPAFIVEALRTGPVEAVHASHRVRGTRELYGKQGVRGGFTARFEIFL